LVQSNQVGPNPRHRISTKSEINKIVMCIY